MENEKQFIPVNMERPEYTSQVTLAYVTYDGCVMVITQQPIDTIKEFLQSLLD